MTKAQRQSRRSRRQKSALRSEVVARTPLSCSVKQGVSAGGGGQLAYSDLVCGGNVAAPLPRHGALVRDRDALAHPLLVGVRRALDAIAV